MASHGQLAQHVFRSMKCCIYCWQVWLTVEDSYVLCFLSSTLHNERLEEEELDELEIVEEVPS